MKKQFFISLQKNEKINDINYNLIFFLKKIINNK